MSNFFEKLKKGMGIDISKEKEEVRVPKEKGVKIEKTLKENKLPVERSKKLEIETKLIESEPEIKKERKIEVEKPTAVRVMVGKEKWLEPEGQLAVDVYQTIDELVIQSAIAGVKPEDLDISIEGDVIEISGERKKPLEEGDYFSQECYWGKFSRRIILPVEIDPDGIEATLKDGILTIKMHKIQKEKKRKIFVRG